MRVLVGIGSKNEKRGKAFTFPREAERMKIRSASLIICDHPIILNSTIKLPSLEKIKSRYIVAQSLSPSPAPRSR